MKKIKYQFLISLVLLLSAIPVFAQNENSAAIDKMPGWGVQSYTVAGMNTLTPWEELVAEAFHFSPDGSFYENSGNGVQVKYVTTFYAKEDIFDHSIPIDTVGITYIQLDDQEPIPIQLNGHYEVNLDFTKGTHTLKITNAINPAPYLRMGIVVGKCLWGKDKTIDFVKAGSIPSN